MASVRILFLCTGNSARSQIAEAVARQLGGSEVEAFSAGSDPRSQVHPLAIQTLEDAGVDAGGLRPKHLSTFAGQKFDYVITVCDRAREACPVFPDANATHWGLPDPAAEPPETAPEAFQATLLDLWLRIRFLLEYAKGGNDQRGEGNLGGGLLDFATRALLEPGAAAKSGKPER
jgi:protein-tyrosine-phosphatase